MKCWQPNKSRDKNLYYSLKVIQWNTEIIFCWDIMSGNVVDRNWNSGKNFASIFSVGISSLFLLPWRWGRHLHPRRWYLPAFTEPHPKRRYLNIYCCETLICHTDLQTEKINFPSLSALGWEPLPWIQDIL